MKLSLNDVNLNELPITFSFGTATMLFGELGSTDTVIVPKVFVGGFTGFSLAGDGSGTGCGIGAGTGSGDGVGVGIWIGVEIGAGGVGDACTTGSCWMTCDACCCFSALSFCCRSSICAIRDVTVFCALLFVGGTGVTDPLSFVISLPEIPSSKKTSFAFALDLGPK